MATADYIHKQELSHILAALTPQNRLAVEISLATGLRISDVLNLQTEKLRSANLGRFTVRELKTGKNKRLKLNSQLLDRALASAGRFFVFENRLDPRRPRTRQAVYKDLVRARHLFRVKNLNITPHSARKVYAVEQYHKSHDLRHIQTLLNHSSEAVTVLYAMADELTSRKLSSLK